MSSLVRGESCCAACTTSEIPGMYEGENFYSNGIWATNELKLCTNCLGTTTHVENSEFEFLRDLVVMMERDGHITKDNSNLKIILKSALKLVAYQDPNCLAVKIVNDEI